MITQTITASMTQTSLSKILTRRYDVGREIKFILYKDELLSDPIDLTDYTVVITVIKPDNNFVIQNFVGDTVTITDQMEVVTGTGYYCVHVAKGTETIYTGQGEFIIDDVLISDDELESISEVNGLKFPDDFLTVEDHVAVIDDTVTTTEKTWSSSKISDEIENTSVVVSKTAEGNPIEISDGASAPLVECVTQITGSQDLHGYDKPWVGGAGKNKLPMTVSGIKSINTSGTWNGNTYTYRNVDITILTDSDDNIIGFDVNGTASANLTYFIIAQNVTVSATSIFSCGFVANWNINGYVCEITDGTNTYIPTEISGVEISASTYTVRFALKSASTLSHKQILPMIRLSTETDPTFSPYSNICPITAYTKGEIEVSDGDGNTTTHTTTYPSAIYRGSDDCVNGSVETEKIKIQSDGTGFLIASNGILYNDSNILTGVSSVVADLMQTITDKYDFFAIIGGTAGLVGQEGKFGLQIIGNVIRIAICDSRFTTAEDFRTYLANNPLEIAYKLATPTTSSVTPTNLPIKSLLGYNHIESSTGNIEIEYITQDYQPLVDSIVTESERKITKLWDAGFTPAPGVWLEYDFGEDLENYDAIVILFVVSGWEGNNSDSVTVYPKIQNLNTTKYYHYIKGTDYGIQFWRVSGTTYGLGSIDGNYPPQYKAVYGIKY